MTMAEPALADFSVRGGPQILGQGDADAGAAAKPVLLYLPGLELTGYSLHRQVPGLQEDFEVRSLSPLPRCASLSSASTARSRLFGQLR